MCCKIGRDEKEVKDVWGWGLRRSKCRQEKKLPRKARILLIWSASDDIFWAEEKVTGRFSGNPWNLDALHGPMKGCSFNDYHGAQRLPLHCVASNKSFFYLEGWLVEVSYLYIEKENNLQRRDRLHPLQDTST